MSPPLSPTSSPKTGGSPRSRSQSPLSLDLSSLPPLIQPSPPSNTLILTNFNDPEIFSPPTLQKIRNLLSAQSELNSFAPIRSFHRIIVSYHSNDAAIAARQTFDGTSTKMFLPPNPDGSDTGKTAIYDRIRCYFGEPTPVLGEDSPDRHLKAPNPGKLFFISPPPSPPCGWEVREEEPPNKETHAEDLERALATLSSGSVSEADLQSPHDSMSVDVSPVEEEGDGSDIEGRRLLKRKRARSTTVYHPKDHGSKEDLPAVIVSDTGFDEDENTLALGQGAIMAHTSRPPVELMEQ